MAVVLAHAGQSSPAPSEQLVLQLASPGLARVRGGLLVHRSRAGVQAALARDRMDVPSTPRDILLIGAHARACLAICRALGRTGHRVSILRTTPHRTPADHSRYCAA